MYKIKCICEIFFTLAKECYKLTRFYSAYFSAKEKYVLIYLKILDIIEVIFIKYYVIRRFNIIRRDRKRYCMNKVLLIGEPMELLTAVQDGALSEVCDFHASVAGAELNVAVGVSRLGLTARYMTRLGADPRAQRIRSFMADNGIADDLIITDPEHQTGCMMKSKAAPPEQEIYYYRQKTAAFFISEADIDALDLSDIRAIHITGILPAISDTAAKAARRLLERAQALHITVVFDPNLRGILWTTDKRVLDLINEIAAMSEVFLPNLNEAEKLCGEVICFLHYLQRFLLILSRPLPQLRLPKQIQPSRLLTTAVLMTAKMTQQLKMTADISKR